MKVLMILALALGVCSAYEYDEARLTNVRPVTCSYPSWKCDCKIIYDCDGDGEYPRKVETDPDAGVVKDLAPLDYPLRIAGKAWRQNKYNQEDYCKTECRARMNAFLSLDDGEFTQYSYSAVCMKLFALDPSPFAQSGADEPCCALYLEYGREWCREKWYVQVGTARCLTRAAVDFSEVATGATTTNVFSVESGCTADGSKSYNWCDLAPTCTGDEM